VTDFMLYSCV